MKSKMQEYRKRVTSDLVSELEEMQRECFNIRFQQASEKATNAGLLRNLRREVARIKTVLRERELGHLEEE
ncbi:MAG: 50S ribosomal protein L29 [Planctomycetota bacterium]|jgi:large subunit ribosomal protein L29